MKKMINSNQLNLSDGEIQFFGFNTVMLPAFTLTKLIEEIYERHGGDEALNLLFEVGKAHGQYAVDQIGKKHEIPKRQLLDQGLYTADALGLGRYRIEKLNIEQGEIVFRIEDSPFHEEFKKSEVLSDLDRNIDQLQRGMCHKTAQVVLDGEVESEETHCAFQGDQHCRVVVRRKG